MRGDTKLPRGNHSALFIVSIIILFIAGGMLAITLLGTSKNSLIDLKDFLTPHALLLCVEIVVVLVGGILALFTIVGVLFERWLKHNVDETKDLVLENKEEVSKVNNRCDVIEKGYKDAVTNMENTIDAAIHNIILSADLALMNLPDITFTQQVPTNLLQSLAVLESTFTSREAGSEIWEKLGNMENGARIRYARGLYHFGKDPLNVEKYKIKLTGDSSSEVKETSVIDLFEEAREKNDKTGKNLWLKRNILVRLCQAYRQISNFDKARKTLKDLEDLDQDDGDPLAWILAQWGYAVIDLQEGLKKGLDLSNRQKKFSEAHLKMEGVFKDVFGWRSEGGQGKGRFYQVRKSASIAYYTAKAMWSLRCTYERDITTFKDIFPNSKKFIEKLEDALDHSVYLLEERIDAGIECSLASAIYHACLAFTLTVKKCIAEIEDYPRSRNRSDEQKYEKPDATRWDKCLENCLKVADEQRTLLEKLGTSAIYCEGTEKLDNLSMFAKDLDLLSKAQKNPEVLFNFYKKGDRPE